MQTLVFNTTSRTVTLYENTKSQSPIIYSFYDVPTVKASELFYEVMQESDLETVEGKKQRFPVARFPIATTNMLIEK